MRIGFIGVGKLGMPCAEVMAQKGHEVSGYDTERRKSQLVTMFPTVKGAIAGRDIVFVAVPTPHDPSYDGREPTAHLPPKDFDYDIVKQVLTQANEHMNENQLLVLISTVLPGTVRRELEPLVTNTRFVYNPYLIAMGSVAWDMVNPEMIMIGTNDGSETGDAKQLVDFYKTIMENEPRYVVGTWDECECIKVFYNCYSDDTEVLTSTGWKLFKDAIDTDQVLSLDPATMLPEWLTPDKWVSRDYNGSMIHFHSSKDDVLVTSGHNMFVGSMSTKNKLPGKNYGYNWKLEPAHDVIKRKGFVFQRSTEWHNNSPKTVTVNEMTFATEDYVQFMAWFLSEGCICNQSGRIIISQCSDVNPDKYEMINEVFSNIYNNHPEKDRYRLLTGRTGISVLWPELSTYLSQFGKSFDKFIPGIIKDLGKDMIRLFLDTYNLADGAALHTTHFNGTKSPDDQRYKYYASSSDQMAADLGELIIKVGRSPSYRTTRTELSNKDCHLIYELVNKTSLYQSSSSVGLKFNSVDYTGKVYCAMLPKNHIFLTRRNGKCTWQGNTFISAKIGLVNMVQDVAEQQGNINVDVVTDALAQSTMRIMGPQYMKAGMGDGGGCVLGDFLVNVDDKEICIAELYDCYINDTDQTRIIKSANYACSKIDYKKIDQVTSRHYTGKMYKFIIDDAELITTADHLIPVWRNNLRIVVRADNVLKTDKLYVLDD